MSERPFVSRAGEKLEHALETFGVDVTGLVCADFGCNVGGFTDCLLRRGAARVYAVDTGYGTLAYDLRCDDRVTVMERTNALHADQPDAPVDLVTIDLAWTRQRRSVPVALHWLGGSGRIISLVKPHYELEHEEKRRRLDHGHLDPADAERVFGRVQDAMPTLGARVIASCVSPLTGGKGGNREYLVLMEPASSSD